MRFSEVILKSYKNSPPIIRKFTSKVEGLTSKSLAALNCTLINIYMRETRDSFPVITLECFKCLYVWHKGFVNGLTEKLGMVLYDFLKFCYFYFLQLNRSQMRSHS